MKIKILFLSLLSLAQSLWASDCPSTIHFSNGNYLKSGSTIYFPNGNYFHSGSTTYYPSGSYLQSGSTVYYPNGNYLSSGSTLYYPTGNYLRSGTTFYYPNGNYLKSGSTFYYPNGYYARSGTTLYLENGNTTTFPINLSALIGDFGSLRAKVEQSSEMIDMRLINLFSTPQAQMEHLSLDPMKLTFSVGTGIEGQRVVFETAADGQMTNCTQQIDSPLEITIVGSKGRAVVSLNPGVDSEHIRRLIEEALR